VKEVVRRRSEVNDVVVMMMMIDRLEVRLKTWTALSRIENGCGPDPAYCFNLKQI